MKSLFSALLIAAFTTTILFFNQKNKPEKPIIAGDNPILLPPPLRVIQSETTFYIPVSNSKANNI